MRNKVSIITPTWQRNELLLATIQSVKQQTYRPLEHVVVFDGPGNDDAVEDAVEEYAGTDIECMVYQLGYNTSTLLTDSYCAAPAMVATFMATAPYHMWLVDDELMMPDHIEKLVDALERDDSDFAYSKVLLYWANSIRPPMVIGKPEPEFRQITNALYKRELLSKGIIPFEEGIFSDWACIQRWMQRGAKWSFVPEVTLTHRVDH